MELGKKILKRMAELGIKSRVKLADKISRGGVAVHPNTVGKWISGEAKPRGENLIALAKALEIKAELLVLEEGQNPEELADGIRELIHDVVKTELKALLGRETATLSADSDLSRFFESPDIPEEDKKAILRQIKNLLKMYDKEE